MADHQRLYAAVDWAIDHGQWRPEDVEAVLRGVALDAKGCPVACCEGCGKPEWMDGLVPTVREQDGPDDTPIISGFYCPQCQARRLSRG